LYFLVQGCNYVGADRLKQTRRDNTTRFKQTRGSEWKQSKESNTVNTIKLQAAPVTVHISKFTMTQWRT